MSYAPVSRTAPCPCGSGKRYKHCCGASPIAGTTSAAQQVSFVADPDTFPAAQAFHQAGNLDEAERIYRKLHAQQPDDPAALHYLGVCRYQRGDYQAAAEYIRAALDRSPHEAMANNNLGLVYKELNQLPAALEYFNQAIVDDPNNAIGYNNRGLVLHDLGRFDEAIADFAHAADLRNDFPEAFSNLSKTLLATKRFADALECATRAVELNPGLPTAHANLGSALRGLQRQTEALRSWDEALRLQPDFAEVHFNRGGALSELRRYEEASANYDHAFALKPTMSWLRGDRLHARMHCCDWRDLDLLSADVLAAVNRGEPAAGPFTLLALPATAAQQQRAARALIADKLPADRIPAPRVFGYTHDRIRLAYVSADFRDHATSHLIAGLVERHDRAKFEVIGVYIGPPGADAWRTRMERSFDRFVDVGFDDDEQIATVMRDMEIDIAVDLMGHTAMSRPGVFALRTAPIQVNYLGYPGTSGAPFFDYLIADATVIPQDHRSFYNEKIAYLPNSYQVNDASKVIADHPFDRRQLGLPEQAFVFCCFNNNFKITPLEFDIWMRLLLSVEGSVLWLLQGNDAVVRNLRDEATRRGVDPNRLVFAPRMALADHLARHRAADLFVDTFYCNAHTTASDALWAGLPVLTRAGETFAGRVAASLLNAVGMPELITRSAAEYEKLALELATSSQRLRELRTKLERNRDAEPLFNTQLYTDHIESAFEQMHERKRTGLSAEHIVVRG